LVERLGLGSRHVGLEAAEPEDAWARTGALANRNVSRLVPDSYCEGFEANIVR
jgi:hypothetical protein